MSDVSLKELLKKAKTIQAVLAEAFDTKLFLDAKIISKDEANKSLKTKWVKLSDVEAFVAGLRTLRNDTKMDNTKLNDDLKIIQDEIERGSYSSLQEVFDVMFYAVDRYSKKVLKQLDVALEEGAKKK